MRVVSDSRALRVADFETIERILGEWGDDGFSPLDHNHEGFLYAAWDARAPAFSISRDNDAIRLRDNLSVDVNRSACGTFSSVPMAMDAVRCILRGDYDTQHAEVRQFFDARLGRFDLRLDRAAA